MLAKYCDMILKKGPNHISDEAVMERTLSDVVSLFAYLPDKDIFMLVYSKLLSRRLINDTSANDDFEGAMINKLKKAQGFEFCSRLQRMLQDMATSKDINNGFRDFCEQREKPLKIDFSINVLATGCWPLQAPTTNFELPAELVPAVQAFKDYYNSKYSGRKLTYLNHLSKAELQCTYAMKGRLRLTTSTFQLGCLLQFNNGFKPVNYGQLKSALALQYTQLKIALLGLLKVRLLKCEHGIKHATWTDATKFAVQRNYKSKRNRVNCNVPVDTKDLKSAPAAAIDPPEVRRERELKLQAAIVRIMKARKELAHNELVAEATTQVAKWFKPKISTIKRVIEYLIENEYIRRAQDADGNSLRKYEYVA